MPSPNRPRSSNRTSKPQEDLADDRESLDDVPSDEAIVSGVDAQAEKTPSPPIPPKKSPFTSRALELQKKAATAAQQIKRRVGQTIKCPGCQTIAHVDKTYPKTQTRRLVCKNPECNKLKTTGRPWSRVVSISSSVLNEEEDYGVMSDRQRAHYERPRE